MSDTKQIIETLENFLRNVTEEQQNKSYWQQWFTRTSAEWPALLNKMETMDSVEFNRVWDDFIREINDEIKYEEAKQSSKLLTYAQNFYKSIIGDDTNRRGSGQGLFISLLIFGPMIAGLLLPLATVLLITGATTAGILLGMVALLAVTIITASLLTFFASVILNKVKVNSEHNLQINQTIIDINDQKLDQNIENKEQSNVLNKVFTFFKREYNKAPVERELVDNTELTPLINA